MALESYREQLAEILEDNQYLSPPAEDERVFGSYIDLAESLAKERMGWRANRNAADLFKVFGLPEDYVDTLFVGKSVANLCCGESPLLVEALAIGATNVLGIDMDKKALAKTGLPKEQVLRHDLSKPLPSYLRRKFGTTINMFGTPFWSRSAPAAVQAIRNQADITSLGGVMVNGPIIEPRWHFKGVPWEQLSQARRYRMYLDLEVLKEVEAMGRCGFETKLKPLPNRAETSFMLVARCVQ